jgi:hypothetical protein
LKKRIPTRQIVLSAVFGILLFAALMFLCGAGGSISQRVVIFAILLLATGLLNLMGASTLPAASDAPEWPMIQGLLDVMMAIMLFMSSGTRLPTLLLILMAIWAVMGALARAFSAAKLKGALRRLAWFHTGGMVAGGALFLAGALIEALDPALCIGFGLIFCALGSLWFKPRRRKG